MDKHGEQSTQEDPEARFNFPHESPCQHPSVSADLLSSFLQRPMSPFVLPSPPPLTLLHQLLGLSPVFLTLFTPFDSAAAAAKSLQSYLTLCDPIDGSPSGSPVPGILQARTLEWVAISFSNA